jgi:hypothetical protein
MDREIMKLKVKEWVLPHRRLLFSVVFCGTLLAAKLMYAPIVVSPTYIAINASGANTVSLTVTNPGGVFPITILMATNLPSTNWIGIYTNFSSASPWVLTNLPATNRAAFFRLRI